MNGLLQALSIDGYISVNKNLIRKVGLHTAVMIGELVSVYLYWESRNELNEFGEFYLTTEDCLYNTGLSYHEQTTALDKLSELGIVSTSLKGMPRVRYIKLNEDAVLDLLNSDIEYIKNCNLKNETPVLDILNPVVENIKTNNNKNNNRNNKDIFIINNKENPFGFQQMCPESPLSSFPKKEEVKIHKERDEDKPKKKDPMTSKAYNVVVSFINSINFSNKETTEELLKWYSTIGKGRVSSKDIQNKLDAVAKECKNEDDLREAINKAYLNGWFGFYVGYTKFDKTKRVDNSQNKCYNEPKECKQEDIVYARNPDGTLFTL